MNKGERWDVTEHQDVVPNRSCLYDSALEYIAEIYDSTETQTDDVHLLRSLIGKRQLNILEVFCGHGRILLPLAEDGHQIVGLDLSETFLDILRSRIEKLPESVQKNITCRRADAVKGNYPTGFDLVILGANCLYELATAEDQEACIKAAAQALNPGGYLFLDNNHMEGSLDDSWRNVGEVNTNAFPSGDCADGTRVDSTSEVIWYDAEQRLVRYRRVTEVRTPDGNTHKTEFVVQTYPPSTVEMQAWLQKHGFVIENLWGDRKQSTYVEESSRAIFWAKLDKE